MRLTPATIMIGMTDQEKIKANRKNRKKTPAGINLYKNTDDATDSYVFLSPRGSLAYCPMLQVSGASLTSKRKTVKKKEISIIHKQQTWMLRSFQRKAEKKLALIDGCWSKV